MKWYRYHARRGRGFTLLELIVVITIIGILGTLVVVKVSGLIGVSQEAKIKNDLQTIIRSAEYWYSRTGYFPSMDELKSGKDRDSKDVGVQLPPECKDPWGNEYQYDAGDGKPKAYCYGRDGAIGGDGENKDYEEPQASTSSF